MRNAAVRIGKSKMTERRAARVRQTSGNGIPNVNACVGECLLPHDMEQNIGCSLHLLAGRCRRTKGRAQSGQQPRAQALSLCPLSPRPSQARGGPEREVGAYSIISATVALRLESRRLRGVPFPSYHPDQGTFPLTSWCFSMLDLPTTRPCSSHSCNMSRRNTSSMTRQKVCGFKK